jgi:hypothetical protein
MVVKLVIVRWAPVFVIMNIEKAGLGTPSHREVWEVCGCGSVYRRRVGKNNFDNNQASSFLVVGGF